MADLLRREPCAVAAIGPLTNIGLLARDHPDAFRQITALLIVAGRTAGNVFTLGGKGPVRDFNFENDPIAAQLALTEARGQVEVVMAGFATLVETRQQLVTRYEASDCPIRLLSY